MVAAYTSSGERGVATPDTASKAAFNTSQKPLQGVWKGGLLQCSQEGAGDKGEGVRRDTACGQVPLKGIHCDRSAIAHATRIKGATAAGTITVYGSIFVATTGHVGAKDTYNKTKKHKRKTRPYTSCTQRPSAPAAMPTRTDGSPTSRTRDLNVSQCKR